MIWRILTGRDDPVLLRISDEFFEWLRLRVDDAEVRAFDPYVDRKLDAEALTRWRSALARTVSARQREMEADLRAARRLPRDPAAREALLTEWVARELSGDAHYRMLRELEATIALALESGATVETIGD